MTADLIIYLVITTICAAPLIGIGISQYKSKVPVGFWSGKEPPKKEQISNVTAYNKKHGIMWLLYGIGLIICALSGLFINGTAAATATIIEVVCGIFLMVAYHNKLDRTYMIK